MIGSENCTSSARALQMWLSVLRRRHYSIYRLARILWLLLAVPSLAYSAGAQYVYDRAGRLIQVIAPNGSSAIYNYDATGNILSIQRISNTTPAVTGFSAWSASTGGTITIYGSGFSTTPGQNQVTFNGVNATVVSATTNTLVVTVPSGATQGTVTVTNSNGSAGSSAPFTPGTAHAAPTLLSATPHIGAAGNVVTLGGSGFPWGTDNNEVSFNGLSAQIATVTPAAMQVSAPSAVKSGSIEVTGAYGTAQGVVDFFAPTSLGFNVTDVDTATSATGRLYVDDGPFAPTIASAGKKAMVLMDAIANEELSLQLSGSTFPSGCSTALVQLYRPGSTSQVGVWNSCARAEYYKVTHSGTHTFVISPNSTNTGSVSLSAVSAPTVTTPISLGDPSTTVTTTVPAQRGAVTFATSTASQIVSVQLTNAQYQTACGNQTLKLLGPAPATTQIASRNLCTSATAYTLVAAGTYTALVDPYLSEMGSVGVKVDDAPTVTGTLTLGGSALPVSTTVPAQLAKVTFASATANQSVSVIISGSTYPSACSLQSLKLTGPAPATTQRGSTNLCNATRTYTLGAVGTYTLTVTPYSFDTGGVTLRVQ